MNTVVANLRARVRPVEGTRRWSWWLSVAIPLLPLAAIALAEATGWRALLALPIGVIYGLIPLLDAWAGTDPRNPREEAVPMLEGDRYYRVLTWLVVPLHFVVLAAGLAYVVLGTDSMVERVGSNKRIRVDVRVISSTNHDLAAATGKPLHRDQPGVRYVP